jgi:hypothetical protein
MIVEGNGRRSGRSTGSRIRTRVDRPQAQSTAPDDVAAEWRRSDPDSLGPPWTTREPSCTERCRQPWSRIHLVDQLRPCGSSQSMIGPWGTMPVGFTLSWLR